MNLEVLSIIIAVTGIILSLFFAVGVWLLSDVRKVNSTLKNSMADLDKKLTKNERLRQNDFNQLTSRIDKLYEIMSVSIKSKEE